VSTAPHGTLIHVETTVYRLPEVQRARRSFDDFVGEKRLWSNDFDQWCVMGRSNGTTDDTYRLSA
jgi:hypothetical protein